MSAPRRLISLNFFPACREKDSILGAVRCLQILYIAGKTKAACPRHGTQFATLKGIMSTTDAKNLLAISATLLAIFLINAWAKMELAKPGPSVESRVVYVHTVPGR